MYGVKKKKRKRDSRAMALNRWHREEARAHMPYSEFLKTKYWLKLRKRVLVRDGYRCTLCDVGDEVLHVHHKTYERRGRERLDDLVTLCGDCHKKHHDGDEDGIVDKMDILALRNGPTEARKLATI